MQNFSYIISDEKTKEAAIVDAGWDVDELIGICNTEKLLIKKIMLTHYHYDHIQKTDELASRTDAQVYCHEDDFDEIKKSIKNPNIKIHKLKDGDRIDIGKINVKIIHTPGHSKGSMCLLIENKLITGDTLFVNAIGRVDLPGGDAIKLFESLQKLKKLKDDVEIYPGHDYGDVPFSTIKREKEQNPYFRCKTKEEFFNLVGF